MSSQSSHRGLTELDYTTTLNYSLYCPFVNCSQGASFTKALAKGQDLHTWVTDSSG